MTTVICNRASHTRLMTEMQQQQQQRYSPSISTNTTVAVVNLASPQHRHRKVPKNRDKQKPTAAYGIVSVTMMIAAFAATTTMSGFLQVVSNIMMVVVPVVEVSAFQNVHQFHHHHHHRKQQQQQQQQLPLISFSSSSVNRWKQQALGLLFSAPPKEGSSSIDASQSSSSSSPSSSTGSSLPFNDENPPQPLVAELSSARTKRTTRRELGSQENLMLPRQYGPGKEKGVVFPSMNHVCCAVVGIKNDVVDGNNEKSSTTTKMRIDDLVSSLKYAVNEVMDAHPLLGATVVGDGEPTERIDLFQMVRKGDPRPLEFVTVDDKNSNNSNNRHWTAEDVVQVVEVDGDSIDLDRSWKQSFVRDLDESSQTWLDVGKTPLWKVELHYCSRNDDEDDDEEEVALLFSFNHAISDQSSASKLIDQILVLMDEHDNNNNNNNKQTRKKPKHQDMPVSLEESVLGKERRFKDVQTEDFTPGTVRYVLGKALEETKSPVILPDDPALTQEGNTNKNNGFMSALSTISGNAAGGDDSRNMEQRRSVVSFKTLSKDATTALLEKCRENDVTITNALSAALTLTSTDFIDGGDGSSSSSSQQQSNKRRNYKILQSLDMRRFGQKLDDGSSVGCLAGSMDLMHGPLQDRSGLDLRTNPTKDKIDSFWELARDGKQQTTAFIESDGPEHAVRVFDFAMTISDMNNLVHLTAQSKDSQGRAYSAGFTNAGVYERLDAFEFESVVVDDDDTSGDEKLNSLRGKYSIKDLYYAASNARTGCLYRMSCMTINGEMKFTFHPASPIVSEETNNEFAEAFIDMLEVISSVSSQDGPTNRSVSSGRLSTISGVPALPENSLVLATAILGTASILSHAAGFSSFFESVMEMKKNAPAEDFWPALNFWIFFAVGHPILQPVLWISDVLHGSPGPKIADLVPVTFLLGNAIAIGAITYSKEIRNAVNVAALCAFLSYVGAGLDGKAGLGDFNLALDDSYKGQTVKGCPSYEYFKQPSMNDFDLNKYQGLWYEQKFHDWTQFKEVYDTTLDIKLTEGGLGWIDDFGVKGPAPDSAKLSWDKSPVANGAHYFLFGRVDPNDPNGILREKGFGVEFPNYIVDVQKDPQTGEYTEAIQFQCLERGGVRVFEGINFMSRKPQMTDQELATMHQRAEQAGMYPFGASPEQMHTVARRPIDAPPIDNSWQAMWRTIGVDKLLELLTESIEDGGR